MTRVPVHLVGGALEHLALVRAHLAHVPDGAELALDAVCMRLSAAIESIGKLPADMRDAVCSGKRDEARGLRNRIAHGYGSVDPVVVLRALEHELDPLERGLEDLAEVLAAPAPDVT